MRPANSKAGDKSELAKKWEGAGININAFTPDQRTLMGSLNGESLYQFLEVTEAEKNYAKMLTSSPEKATGGTAYENQKKQEKNNAAHAVKVAKTQTDVNVALTKTSTSVLERMGAIYHKERLSYLGGEKETIAALIAMGSEKGTKFQIAKFMDNAISKELKKRKK